MCKEHIMVSTTAEATSKALPSNTNGPTAAKTADSEGLTHRFQEGLGTHPLWNEYMAELEANRQADIAEANRQADLALE